MAIKGIREGLLVTLGKDALDAALARLSAELDQKRGFFNGSQVTLAAGERILDQEQLTEVQSLLERHEMSLWAVLANNEATREAARGLGLATRLAGSNMDLEGQITAAPMPAAAPEPDGQESAPGGDGLLLHETLRSGRSVFHQGHVVVIGDVNPGAEIIAAGDVVVWGRLRGMVHAGALGDASAVICALELIPTQLRIADYIAISPHEQGRPSVPEKASVNGDQIVAETWDSRP